MVGDTKKLSEKERGEEKLFFTKQDGNSIKDFNSFREFIERFGKEDEEVTLLKRTNRCRRNFE